MRNLPLLKTALPLLPFAALLVVLPFPGTVSARLIFIAAAFIVALILCFLKPDLRRVPPAQYGIALWVVVCVLSLFYSVDPEYSVKELKNEIAYSLIVFFSFFVIAQNRQQAQLLLRSLALGFLLIGSIALYGWFKAGFHWLEHGVQGGVGSFATYVVTCMPALFWISVTDSDAYWRWFGRLLIGFAAGLAFITLQRAVWPALLVELLIAIFLTKRAVNPKMKTRHMLGVTALFLAMSLVVFSSTNKLRGVQSISSLMPSSDTFSTPVAQQDGSDGDARLPYWPAIVTTIAKHPVVGAGFGIGIMKKAYPELVPTNYPALWHAHNVVLNYAIQLGIPGALALLIMLFALVWHFWKSLKQNPTAATAAIAGIMLVAGVLLRNQTNDFFRRDMALLFWCLMGIFCALIVAHKKTE